MVAGEDAQTPRVDLETLCKAELGRKICNDRVLCQHAVCFVKPGAFLLVKIAPLNLIGLGNGRLELVGGSNFFKPSPSQIPEEQDRIVTQSVPRSLINPLKDPSYLSVPSPVQVRG